MDSWEFRKGTIFISGIFDSNVDKVNKLKGDVVISNYECAIREIEVLKDGIWVDGVFIID